MPTKKRARAKQVEIKVGNVSDTSGNINIAGGNVTTQNITSGLTPAEIKQLFDQVYSAIEQRPASSPTEKGDLKAEVQEIQSTVTEAARTNSQVDEGFLSRHFRNIARMAPDILDVVVATLGSPLAGLGVVAKKIAAKAKEEAGHS